MDIDRNICHMYSDYFVSSRYFAIQKSLKLCRTLDDVLPFFWYSLFDFWAK